MKKENLHRYLLGLFLLLAIPRGDHPYLFTRSRLFEKVPGKGQKAPSGCAHVEKSRIDRGNHRSVMPDAPKQISVPVAVITE